LKKRLRTKAPGKKQRSDEDGEEEEEKTAAKKKGRGRPSGKAKKRGGGGAGSTARGRKPKKAAAAAAEDEEWEVERIEAIKITRAGNKEYEVKWVGFAKTSWEPEGNVESCEDKVQEFCEKIGLQESAGRPRKQKK